MQGMGRTKSLNWFNAVRIIMNIAFAVIVLSLIAVIPSPSWAGTAKASSIKVQKAAPKTKSAYTITTEDSKLNIRAKHFSLHALLKEIGKKTGMQVVIHEKVPDKKVTILENALPYTQIPRLLEKLGVTNSAMLYDKQAKVMALYLLPRGKSVNDLLKANPFLVKIEDSRIAASRDTVTVKGKPVIMEEQGHGKIPISYVQGEILLKFNPEAAPDAINNILRKYQLTAIPDKNLAKLGYIKAVLPENKDMKEATQELRKEYDVRRTEFNYILKTLGDSGGKNPKASSSIDPLYAQQWYVPDTRFDLIYDALKHKNTVGVAVIDTGINAAHPDLQGKILPGYDFVENTGTPGDDHGHGTFVAGIIAANANAIGIRGLYDYARIIPVKVIDKNGMGTYEDVAKGIIWAADHGAGVINLSIGGDTFSYLLQDAVNYALEKGCIVVAAGGNDGVERLIYPAAYPDVIGVSALSRNGAIWPRSNSGRHIVVAAPGDDIISTGNADYLSASGTSSSAAMVSALAAMLKVERPNLSSSVIAQLIAQTARDLGEKGRDKIFGAGEIDAQAAFTQDVTPFHDVAVRRVAIDSRKIKKTENIRILALVQNVGTYPVEDFTATLFEIIDGNKTEVETMSGKVAQKKVLTFKRPPNIAGKEIQYEVAVSSPDDVRTANDSAKSKKYTVADKGTFVILYDNRPPVHQWIALQAYKALINKHGNNAAIVKELQQYLPLDENGPYYSASFSNAEWYDKDENLVGPSATALIEGAFEEDGTGINELRCSNHFWNPDGGTDDGLDLATSFQSALHTTIEGNESWSSDAKRWPSAIASYNPSSNDNREAYYWLGRTSHLLMDMTVPDHVHNDNHMDVLFWGDSSYELYTRTASRYRAIKTADYGLKPLDITSLPLSVPDSYRSPYIPEYGEITKLFYNVAQYTQFYDSDNANGNDVDGSGNVLSDMQVQWRIYSPKGSTRTAHLGYANFLDVDSYFDEGTPVSVEWLFHHYLTGSEVKVSHARGRIFLSDDLYNKVSTLDSFIVYYTKDGVSQSEWMFNIVQFESDILDDNTLENEQYGLQKLATQATASLYELFWKKTHPYAINGTVTDTQGRPLSGIQVQLYASGLQTVLDETLTDSSGNYSFHLALPGSYYIIFSPGSNYYETQQSDNLIPNLTSSTTCNAALIEYSAFNWKWRKSVPEEVFVESSSDGKRLFAAANNDYVYVSDDYGANWTAILEMGSRDWCSISADSSGYFLVAAAGTGSIWSGSPIFGYWMVSETQYPGRSWGSMILPDSGLLIAADQSVNGYIWRIWDYVGGQVWKALTGAGHRQWWGIASSSDSTKLAAVARDDNNIYTSTDGGNTWQLHSFEGYHSFHAIASSADGSRLAAADYYGYIYTSDNFGGTWSKRTSAGNNNWTSIASSSDGRILAAGARDDFIYTSTDSGVTWKANISAGRGGWDSIASSSDGSRLVASGPWGSPYKGIWTGSYDMPAIISAKSNTSDGFYRAGEEIDITLTFNRPVSSSSPEGLQITLSTGAVIKTGALNNVATWSGKYLISEGQVSGDLTITSVAGTIRDYLSFSTDNPIVPVGKNIADNNNIAIVIPVNGACGSSNGGTFATAPATNLCSEGTATAVTGTGPWSWSCTGQNTGTTATCHAYDPPAIASATSSTTDGPYVTGSSIDITLNFKRVVSSSGLTITLNTGAVITTGALNNVTSWSGDYTIGNGETTGDLTITSVTGTIADWNSFSTVNPAIPAGHNIGDGKAIVVALNGACGWSHGGTFSTAPAADLCSYGTATPVTGSGPWNWSCAGQNTGTDAACSANLETFTWAKRTIGVPGSWMAIVSSSDGTKLAAAKNYGSDGNGSYIYTSTDSGQTWTQQNGAGLRFWGSIASSSDGTMLAAVDYGGYVWNIGNGGFIYTSTDSGQTWTEQTDAGTRNWIAITSSIDGRMLAAVVRGGFIYTSTDSGKTWTAQIYAGSRYWRSIASSSDGTKLAAVEDPGYIYTSTDSGATWTQRGTGGYWYSIASSSDGAKLAAVVSNDLSGNGGNIYTSTDSGETWTEQKGAGNHFWRSIASSSDGMKLAAADFGALGYYGYIYTSADSGQTWTARTSPGGAHWQSISSSSDGTKLAALATVNNVAYIWTGSYDLPAIASATSGTMDGSYLAGSSIDITLNFNRPVSSDGLTITLDTGAVITTGAINYVKSWSGNYTITAGETSSDLTVTSVRGTITDENGFSVINPAVTAGHNIGDGKAIVIAQTGACGSSNGSAFSTTPDGDLCTYGTATTVTGTGPWNWRCVGQNDGTTAACSANLDPFTWTERTSAGSRGWFSIASSSDGTKLAAAVANLGHIYTSWDSGATWTEQTGAGTHIWRAIASSSDGTKLVAVGLSSPIVTSADSGLTWTARTSVYSRFSVASSSDGMKLAAVASLGYIYTSTDSGATWTKRTSAGSRSWRSIASSSDGTRLAAVAIDGYIYTSTDSGENWTEQTGAGSRAWHSIASSSDGMKLAAVASLGYIYTSTDSGATWTGQTGAGARNWLSIASSSDGTKLAAVVEGDYIYLSDDSGATWTARRSPGKLNWLSIASSSDGTKLAAVANGGFIWTGSYDVPAITAATSSTADGTYLAGASIDITLNFNKAISSAGLTITLDTGAVITTGAFNNVTSWSGNYAVATRQTSGDLTITSVTGTVTDGNGFSTVNPVIPAGYNIGDGKAIVIALDGACGSSNGGIFSTAPAADFCSYGTATSLTGSGPWSWICVGENGGTDATCSANLDTSSWAAEIASFYANLKSAMDTRDLAAVMNLFDSGFLHNGKSKAAMQAEVQELFNTYSIVQMTYDPVNISFSGYMAELMENAVFQGIYTMTGEFNTKYANSPMILKRIGGSWKYYGNQRKYGVAAVSSHTASDGFYGVKLSIYDPTKAITELTATGYGISSSLNLGDFLYNDSSGYWILKNDIKTGDGINPPPSTSAPWEYSFRIVDNVSGIFDWNDNVEYYVPSFPIPTSPSANAIVTGPLSFAWTGLSSATPYYYGVSVYTGTSPLDMVPIWSSPPTVANTITYSGPALAEGYYYYTVNAFDPYGNASTSEIVKFQYATRKNLSIQRSGTGQGTIQSNDSPQTINCGSICTNTYDTGTLVTLKAAPVSGSIFTGWLVTGVIESGCATSGSGDCRISMFCDTDVIGKFSTAVVNPPKISFTVAAKGWQATNVMYVDLKIANTGTGNAQNIIINRFTFKTLAGTGTVTSNVLSLATPFSIANLNAGASQVIRVYLNVPSTIVRFSLTESGTVQDALGTRFNFTSSQAVFK